MASCALVLLAQGCSNDPSGAEEPSSVTTSEPVATFAPLVHLHPRERWLPIAAIDFIASSVLRWRDQRCGSVALAAGPYAGSGRPGEPAGPPGPDLPKLTPERLAGTPAPYRFEARTGSACRPGRRTFTTLDYTRPHDPRRGNGLRPDQGFVLDLADSELTGVDVVRSASGAPFMPVQATFEIQRERSAEGPLLRITYWLLFGMEGSVESGPAVRSRIHEGDWERVSVLLRVDGSDRYTPLSVRYHRGAAGENVPWRAVRRAGRRLGTTHPAVYLMRGVHTPLPRPGRGASACPNCIEWRMWERPLDAAIQGWRGYGGGWGNARSTPTGLGPSRWADSGTG